MKFNTEIYPSRLSDRSAILQIFNTSILRIETAESRCLLQFLSFTSLPSPYLPSYRATYLRSLAFLSHPFNLSIPPPLFPSSILSQVSSGKWRLKHLIKGAQEQNIFSRDTNYVIWTYCMAPTLFTWKRWYWKFKSSGMLRRVRT